VAELRPYPFGALVTRMFRERRERDSIFDLPARRFFNPGTERDYGVLFHGRRAATPLGPAAGPQSQMAQNLVLSWLGGSRIFELKTVQVDDELRIPRPCIDMQTVGFNVEWSQELKLEASLEEYVKGAMLIRMLEAAGELGLGPEREASIFDMSVGYDLAGIKSQRVQAFVRGMRDSSALVDELRGRIPREFAHLRELEFETRLADSLTLSTFHGCPPDEIERIVTWLLEELGLDCVVKLNPMLLGAVRTRELLDGLGYGELRVPESAFARDATWSQMLDFVGRLGERAERAGRGFGVKLTNTLIVENQRDFFPAEQREMYLSGPPLHVLAMHLVRDFRRAMGDRYPISFSAGIDRKNFPDAVALGLVPITVCSDWLKPGGYGRARGYFEELDERMERVGARSVDDFVLRAYAGAAAAPGDPFDPGAVSSARLANTERYLESLGASSRYARAANSRLPRKIGRRLELFDCITCDKCVPVCPNDANFTFELPPADVPIVKVRLEGGRWTHREDGRLAIAEKHQIASFADFCNDCGNCDVFCPEDGGPYLAKPRFFGSLEAWRAAPGLDGFHLERAGARDLVRGRIAGRELELELAGERATLRGSGFELRFLTRDPLGTLAGEARGEVDLTYYWILRWVRDAVYAPGQLSYPALLARPDA